MPGPPRKGGDGIAEEAGLVRQGCTGRTNPDGDEASLLMEQVVSRENLLLAYRRVVANKGSAGIDGMTVDELMPYCRDHWSNIRDGLLNGESYPKPVREVTIPKPGGGQGALGIPTGVDRLTQQALCQVLTPIFDSTFSDNSFGFRPRRSAHQAVRQARNHIAAGHRWVVDMNLEKFFDKVNHDVLMARMKRRVKDRRVLKLINRYLQAGVMAGGLVNPRTADTGLRCQAASIVDLSSASNAAEER